MNIADIIKSREPPKITIKTDAARRKLAIEDIEKLIAYDSQDGKYPLWRRFTFPIYIPTDWIEGWKDTLIVHSGDSYKRSLKLKELLAQCKNNATPRSCG